MALYAADHADRSPLLPNLRCDGRVVRSAPNDEPDGHVVGHVHDPAFGAILELGCLYVELERDRPELGENG